MVSLRKYLLFVIACVMISSACNFSARELPRLGSLPEFHLLNQENRPVSLENYRGKVWVANFIFTSCAGTCPMLTQRMKKVEASIHEMAKERELPSLQIVSFSVDPERDTPEKLKKYAERFQTDPAYWTFLTGPVDQITRTVVQGFKISMGKVLPEGVSGDATAAEVFDVVHGEKFVLVDTQGRIRGYYDSDSGGIKKLIADMSYLFNKEI